MGQGKSLEWLAHEIDGMSIGGFVRVTKQSGVPTGNWAPETTAVRADAKLVFVFACVGGVH